MPRRRRDGRRRRPPSRAAASPSSKPASWHSAKVGAFSRRLMPPRPARTSARTRVDGGRERRARLWQRMVRRASSTRWPQPTRCPIGDQVAHSGRSTLFAVSAARERRLRGAIRADARDEKAAEQLRDVVRGALAAGRLMAARDPRVDAMLKSLQITGTRQDGGPDVHAAGRSCSTC